MPPQHSQHIRMDGCHLLPPPAPPCGPKGNCSGNGPPGAPTVSTRRLPPLHFFAGRPPPPMSGRRRTMTGPAATTAAVFCTLPLMLTLLLLQMLILVPNLAWAVSSFAALQPHLPTASTIGGLRRIPGATLSVPRSAMMSLQRYGRTLAMAGQGATAGLATCIATCMTTGGGCSTSRTSRVSRSTR